MKGAPARIQTLSPSIGAPLRTVSHILQAPAVTIPRYFPGAGADTISRVNHYREERKLQA